jgi:hypothetical protein
VRVLGKSVPYQGGIPCNEPFHVPRIYLADLGFACDLYFPLKVALFLYFELVKWITVCNCSVGTPTREAGNTNEQTHYAYAVGTKVHVNLFTVEQFLATDLRDLTSMRYRPDAFTKADIPAPSGVVQVQRKPTREPRE